MGIPPSWRFWFPDMVPVLSSSTPCSEWSGELLRWWALESWWGGRELRWLGVLSEPWLLGETDRPCLSESEELLDLSRSVVLDEEGDLDPSRLSRGVLLRPLSGEGKGLSEFLSGLGLLVAVVWRLLGEEP